MPLLSEFNRYFKNELSPYGYIKLKGTHCFAKLVNNEILQYITYMGVNSSVGGKKAFSMLAGIQTIYSHDLSRGNLQATAIDYRAFIWYDPSFQRSSRWNVFYYDDTSIIEALENAVIATHEVAFKYMSRVQDLKAYVNYCKLMCIGRLTHADRVHLDSPLLIKTSNHESFSDFYNVSGKDDPSSCDFREKVRREIQEKIVQPRDRVYESPVLLKKTEAELERRKQINTATLKSYGIPIE